MVGNLFRNSSFDWRDWRQRYTFTRRPKIAVAMFLFALLEMIYRYVEYAFDDRVMQGNTENVWFPLANSVLEGGQLYVSHWDNKPPLFQFVNLGVAVTDHYMLVFWILIGLMNAVTAVLLWEWAHRNGHPRAGLLGAAIFLFALPIANGLQIDPRPFANVFVIGSFLVSSGWVSGLSLGAAGLFTQFSVFVVPALIWYHLRDRPRDAWTRWLGTFVAAGLALVAGTFALVALMWSPESARLGFQYSFLDSGDYVTGYVERGLTIAGNPPGWLFYEWNTVRDHALYYLFGAVAVGTWWYRSEDDNYVPLLVVAVVLLSLPRLIRHGAVYNMLPLPFVSVLAAIGICDFVERRWTE